MQLGSGGELEQEPAAERERAEDERHEHPRGEERQAIGRIAPLRTSFRARPGLGSKTSTWNFEPG